MPVGTTKNKGQKDKLDRFYTPFDEAKRLIEDLSKLDILNINDNTVFIEPSAGDGAFVIAAEIFFPKNKIIALDIAPSNIPVCSTKIIQNDFLEDCLYDKNILTEDIKIDNTVIIGNPPFGEQGKLAVAFVNQSLKYARWCCFILPPSFQKETIQSKLDGKVVEIISLDDTSYRVGNENIDVPSVFVIIDGKQKFTSLPDYSNKLPFKKIPTSKRETADFAIRRVGGTAGNCVENNDDLSSETYYFYSKLDNCPDNIIDIINKCDFPERDWSVGPRSISSKEITKNVYEKFVELNLL